MLYRLHGFTLEKIGIIQKKRCRFWKEVHSRFWVVLVWDFFLGLCIFRLFVGVEFVCSFACYVFLKFIFKYSIIIVCILGVWDAVALLNMKKPSNVFV